MSSWVLFTGAISMLFFGWLSESHTMCVNGVTLWFIGAASMKIEGKDNG